MEDLPTTSSFLRIREAGNRTVDDTSTLIQHLQILEPVQLLFGFCTKPLAELSRATVAELRVNESAIGFYLLLRTLSPTVTVNVDSDFGENALVLAEDHVKNRITCCLYGHVHLRSEPELKELLPVDAVFALKEPVLIACSEQQFVVVVRGPSDLVVIGRSHFLYRDAEALGWRENEGMQLTSKWSRIGDDLFQEQKFYEAGEAYLFALNNCSETSTKLLLNKSLAKTFLEQNRYESAIHRAVKVLEKAPLNEEALYCAGRAQYELREYRKARNFFDTLKRAFPSNKNYLAEFVRCEDRLREAEGHVDVYNLHQSALTDATTLIEHGNFCRNIEFRSGTDNVRGVFATQDMEPGTLILVEKAVLTVFEPSCSSELGVVNFMRTAFKAILKNPNTMGRKLRFLPGGCPVTDYNRRVFCDEVNGLEPFVDVHRLYKILLKNRVKNKINMVKNAPLMYHIYEAASRFQQSCLSNCSFHIYKDVVVLRTCASVLKGEELFLRYYANHLSFREKHEIFEQRGLTCSCSLCVFDKKELTEVHDLRQELKTKFDVQMALGAGVNFSAEERLVPIINELELSYRNRDSLHLLLFIVYRDLAKTVCRNSKDWKDKVLDYVERGLQSVGLSTDFLLSCTEQVNPQIPNFNLMPVVLFDFAGIMLMKEYSSGRLELVEKWVKLILLLERIYRGGNMEMLLLRYSDFTQVQFLLLFVA